jgi:hypothetical protein
VHENAAATELPGACEHLLPEVLDQERILADEQRLQAPLDDGRGDTAADPSLADTDDAVSVSISTSSAARCACTPAALA